jgi:hypothetical protein
MPTYPYAMTIAGLTELIGRLRKKFPDRVDASTMRELGIAPNNETYVLNSLRFIGVLDKDFNRTDIAHDLFVEGDDEFQAGLAKMIEASYKPMFELHGDDAWVLSKDKLATWFRQKDKSSDLVGKRQADTFVRLGELAGKRESQGLTPNVRRDAMMQVKNPRSGSKPPVNVRVEKQTPATQSRGKEAGSPVSLAVRIEVNLPASADQSVYDAIFRSIRANLIDSE